MSHNKRMHKYNIFQYTPTHFFLHSNKYLCNDPADMYVGGLKQCLDITIYSNTLWGEDNLFKRMDSRLIINRFWSCESNSNK